LLEEGYYFVADLGNGGQSHTCVVEKGGMRFLLKRPSTTKLSKEQRFRFRQEAEALQMLEGIGAPKVMEYAFEGDDPYIVMELITGKTLGELVAGKPLTEDQTLDILKKLVDILSRIHNLGMQHRDIKPDNIIIQKNGSVYLIDFGLCRVANGGQDYRTPASKELGNRFLRLPELGKGEKVSSSVSDVTFLTGIFFYMLTGQQPHVLMDEHGMPPHRRANTAERFSNANWQRQTFDKGFAYPIGQRFQSADELMNFIITMKAKAPVNNDDPIAEFAEMLSSPEYKNRNEIIELILKAQKIFIQSAQKSVGSQIGMGGTGPNATDYSVTSQFFLVPGGRTNPQIFWNLTTTLSQDLNTISHFCDFQDPNMQVRTYSVSEEERLLTEYEQIGELRGKEALRGLITQMKNSRR